MASIGETFEARIAGKKPPMTPMAVPAISEMAKVLKSGLKLNVISCQVAKFIIEIFAKARDRSTGRKVKL